MSNATWKSVTNGKTRVTLNVGLATEKRFALTGVALTGVDVIALCEQTTGAVKVRSRTQHDNANADKRGGVKYNASGEMNPADLASELRSALGITDTSKGKGKGGRIKGDTVAPEAPPAPSSNGAPVTNGTVA